jgi:Ca2+-binding RTX toxin-like protein
MTGSDDIAGYGNDLANTMTGNIGDNLLVGGLGADTLEGGGGADTYLYRTAGDSTTASRDTIRNFAAPDKIDLSLIDAVSATAGTNDAFTFVGNAAFSGKAGELRAYQSGGDWLVEGDVNGDSVADLSILVGTFGGHMIAVGDFVL